MKRSNLPILAASAGIFTATLLAGVPTAAAATASTTPLGYTTVECLWSSDTLCSTAGITEKPDFIGKVTGAPAAGVITVDATPGWTADAFANTHYVRFTTGNKVGRYYSVTANGTDTLTIDAAGDDLSTVVADDGVKLIKYWTLGTLFPAATQTTIVQSGGNLGFQRRSEILFPDLESNGINLSSPSDKKYFLKSTGWVAAVTGFPAADDTVVLPDMYFIVRQPTAAQSGGLGDANGTEFVPMGHVEDAPTAVPLNALATGSGSQDNSVAISRPVAVALNEANLIGSGAFQGSNGALGFQRRDELLVFDLNVDTITVEDAGINRASVNKYYYNATAGNWVNTSDNSNADAELVFQPGTGVIVRKYNVAGGASSFWVFDPSNPAN